MKLTYSRCLTVNQKIKVPNCPLGPQVPGLPFEPGNHSLNLSSGVGDYKKLSVR